MNRVGVPTWREVRFVRVRLSALFLTKPTSYRAGPNPARNNSSACTLIGDHRRRRKPQANDQRFAVLRPDRSR